MNLQKIQNLFRHVEAKLKFRFAPLTLATHATLTFTRFSHNFTASTHFSVVKRILTCGKLGFNSLIIKISIRGAARGTNKALEIVIRSRNKFHFPEAQLC